MILAIFRYHHWTRGVESATARRTIIRLLSAPLVLALLPAPTHALSPAQVFDLVKDAVVVVKSVDAEGRLKRQGSGVLVSAGRIATNCHVVDGGASYQVGRGEARVAATLYAEDRARDICLLDATGIGGEPAQLGKAATLKVGDPVFAVGAPRGLELSLSDGIVAQLRGRPPPLIQTTAAISPGSSGGGLFDGDGRLVGLTTLYVRGGQSLNFAMPVEWIGEVTPGRTPASEGGSHTERRRRASALEEASDWHGLLDWCRTWTTQEPTNAMAWNGLGVAYGKLTRYRDALDAFRQAVRINPTYARAWYNLGVAYDKLTRYRDALDAFRQVVRINPKDARAWTALGGVYTALTRHHDAIDPFRQVVRINPDDARAWYNLGVAYGKSGNRTSALESVRELQRRDPALADQLFNQIVPR